MKAVSHKTIALNSKRIREERIFIGILKISILSINKINIIQGDSSYHKSLIISNTFSILKIFILHNFHSK